METGQAFAFYLKAAAPQPIDGVLFGSPTISGTTISGAINNWNFTSKTLTAQTVSGTAVAKTSMDLTFVTPTSTFTSTGTYDKSYDSADTLAAVAGAYTGKSGTGDTFGASVSSTFTISAAGAFTSTNTTTGCVINGSVTPRASGKNVLDTTITFTGAGCLLGNGAVVTGAAIFDAATKGLSWITVNAGKTNVFVFVGTKP